MIWTGAGSSQPKPDEVKMVLYIVEECGIPCFSLAVTEGQMCIRTAKVRPYYFYLFFFFCFGRGTLRSRRRLGSSRVVPGFLSEPIWCKKKLKSAMKTVHHWRPTLMHLGCMIEIRLKIKGHDSLNKYLKSTRVEFVSEIPADFLETYVWH